MASETSGHFRAMNKFVQEKADTASQNSRPFGNCLCLHLIRVTIARLNPAAFTGMDQRTAANPCLLFLLLKVSEEIANFSCFTVYSSTSYEHNCFHCTNTCNCFLHLASNHSTCDQGRNLSHYPFVHMTIASCLA